MKQNTLITAIMASLAIIAAAASCSPDDIPPPKDDDPADDAPYLTVKTDPLTAPASGKTFIIDVASNREISVVSSQTWCAASLMHDASAEYGSLKISVGKSVHKEIRTATITLSAEGCDDALIEVTQDHRLLSSESSLKSFSLKMSKNPGLRSDIAFTYDAATKTFSAMYLKWREAEEPEKFKVTLDFEGEAVFVGETQVESEQTLISLADDFTISVKAEDGTLNDYKVSFNCPQINTELPVLHARPDQLINSKDNYVDTYIELYDKSKTSTGEGWWDSAEKGKIEMRGRGNSTWGLPKKPFRIKFSEKFSPIGLNHAKEKSWVLLAQDMDKSLLRTHLAWEYSRVLFNPNENYHHEKCLNFTPCSRFVNVYWTGKYNYSDTGRTVDLDGEYIGVYQMSDQMERANGRIAVEKLEEADGNNPDKITGGYILETDIHEGNKYTAFRNVKMTYKYPKDDDYHTSQYEYIKDFVNTAEASIYTTWFADPQTGWRQYFDEKSLADFIIIKEFVGDMDGYTSTYMYKRRGYDKIFFGPIWDCDKGWNNDKRVPHREYQPLESLMIHAGFWMPSYVNDDWFHRLWTDETLREFVAERWAAKKGELKAVTDKVLTDMPASMSKAIKANFSVWNFNYQYSSEANMPASSYQAEIERIRDLSETREALLDRLFNE